MKYYLIVNLDKNFIVEKFYNKEESEYRLKINRETYRICNRQFPKLVVIEKND